MLKTNITVCLSDDLQYEEAFSLKDFVQKACEPLLLRKVWVDSPHNAKGYLVHAEVATMSAVSKVIEAAAQWERGAEKDSKASEETEEPLVAISEEEKLILQTLVMEIRDFPQFIQDLQDLLKSNKA